MKGDKKMTRLEKAEVKYELINDIDKEIEDLKEIKENSFQSEGAKEFEMLLNSLKLTYSRSIGSLGYYS